VRLSGWEGRSAGSVAERDLELRQRRGKPREVRLAAVVGKVEIVGWKGGAVKAACDPADHDEVDIVRDQRFQQRREF